MNQCSSEHHYEGWSFCLLLLFGLFDWKGKGKKKNKTCRPIAVQKTKSIFQLIDVNYNLNPKSIRRYYARQTVPRTRLTASQQHSTRFLNSTHQEGSLKVTALSPQSSIFGQHELVLRNFNQ